MPRALLLFTRALLLRCPNCGSTGLFRSWFRLQLACPGCGLRLEREVGYFTGSMTINLVTTEIVWVIAFVALLVRTWPSTPVALLQWGSVGLMVLFPLAFFPHSKTLWLALDLLVRPTRSLEGEHRQSSL